MSSHTCQDDYHQIERDRKGWEGCGEKGATPHCQWKSKLAQSPRKTARRFLRRLKIELPYDPVIPLLGVYPKELQSVS